ncbi:MAG: hypothetical protein MUE60_11860 [Candidatus Eisenbacteria bacterium]|jgi:hypothetical protein|nr:hypothetical protein [Candidatus Eisenbacteria bacterium]
MKPRIPHPLVVAYVSGHGFGHAVRTSVILGELMDLIPSTRVVIKTTAPPWIFRALGRRASVLAQEVDCPPVQADAFSLEIEETLSRMRAWLDHKECWLEVEAAWLRENRPSLVLADISPLALVAANRRGIPAALIANFTWEWILRRAELRDPRTVPLANEFAECTSQATWCFLTSPAVANVDHPRPITVGLVGRRCGIDRQEVRRQLGIGKDTVAVLLSFGGLDVGCVDFAPLADLRGITWLSTSPRPQLPECRCIPRGFEHPCLVSAADVVVGKLGYSTVAETLIHGTPFLSAPRMHWPEDDLLRGALESRLPTARVPWDRFVSGRWREDLLALCGRGRAEEQRPYGGRQVAVLLSAALLDEASAAEGLSALLASPKGERPTDRRHPGPV